MFVRAKRSGKYEYLQVVHNERIDGKVRQRVIATLGRMDVLQGTGQIDALIASCARFAEQTAVLSAHRDGTIQASENLRIGPGLVFDRLWRETGLQRVIKNLLAQRKYEFDVERAVFLTVLHRLFDPGSDRAAEEWKNRHRIDGVEKLKLHHLYRAMAWLGEVLPHEEQAGATPFAARCIKDCVEEDFFEQRRELFSSLDLVFFDTTSIYFEGEGGEEIGEYGKSKDHRPDRKQMIVGVILDGEGKPICCELWPGNTTDVTTLIPIVHRLKKRFHIGSICIVADRGMISKKTIEQLKAPQLDVRFILGARFRAVKEVREEVLSRAGRYREVYPARKKSKDPSPLKVKEVWVEKRRYIVCYNDEQAKKDRADREAILKALEEQLKRGDKSLVGNKGYRKYLKMTSENHFEIDREKELSEARYDGKWVLQTDTELSAEQTALKYKELWMVEAAFRKFKSLLDTRPVYHKRDETIRGHVFCSFLALVLLKELLGRMEARGSVAVEWDRLKDDLEALQEITVENCGRTFVIRTRTQGDAAAAIQAAGVSLGPIMRLTETVRHVEQD